MMRLRSSQVLVAHKSEGSADRHIRVVSLGKGNAASASRSEVRVGLVALRATLCDTVTNA